MARTRTLLLGTCLMVSWTCALVAQSVDSPQSDANVVRATYAKLIFASRLYAIRTGVLDKAQVIDADALGVVLSDIKTGPVSDLRSVLVADLVTKPSGNTLAVTPVNWEYKTSSGQQLRAEAASVAWTNSGYLAEDWKLPFGQLFDRGVIDPGYTRYASFTAKVSYAGDQRQYQALFLFGRDVSGQPITLPIDHIVGASSLLTFIQAMPTPDPLLALPFRYQPAASALIESMRGLPGCSVEPRTQMCCDEASGRCGVSAGMLQVHGFAAPAVKSLNSPGAPPPCFDCNDYDTNGTPHVKNDLFQTQDHGTGYHTGTATFQSHCYYFGASLPCTDRLCSVSVTAAKSTETGFTHVYCHKVPANQTSIDGEANNTCSASWGYGVGGCFACIPCSVSVTVGAAGSNGSASVTVSGGNATLWTWGVGLVAGPCPSR